MTATLALILTAAALILAAYELGRRRAERRLAARDADILRRLDSIDVGMAALANTTARWQG